MTVNECTTSGSSVMRLRSVSKAYPGVRALDSVDIDFVSGEIHGVVGQNGAGKSTLIKIISGVVSPSSGTMSLLGEDVAFAGSRDAVQGGVAVVHQEFQSLMGMSVLENVLLGSPATDHRVVSWRAAWDEAVFALDRVGLGDMDVQRKMEDLTPAQRKLVEIARALYLDSSLLLLDEPTAALESADSDMVIDCMKRLRKAGRSVVFISHHLAEIFDCCDRITVLRDGAVVGTYTTADVSMRQIVAFMVGSEFDDVDLNRSPISGTPMLQVEGWTVDSVVRDVSLDIAAGEVVGLAGLIGSGRSELAQSLFGAVPHRSGTLRLAGKPCSPRNPADAVRLGMAYVPADRQSEGLVFTMSLRENISLSILKRLKNWSGIDRRAEREICSQLYQRLSVKASGLQQLPETLSGGNQQKVLLARWLASNPSLIMLDEPTQGIDIAAKSEVHLLISELAEAGLGVLVISSDLTELVALCDRCLVMRRGIVVDEFVRGVTETELLLSVTDAAEAQA